MAVTRVTPGPLITRALGPATWPAYADLAERHNGVWGGCWCTWFHEPRTAEQKAAETPRERKERLVAEDATHAAVVFDGDEAVGWAQFGPLSELPRINHEKEVEAAQVTPPDYRITCFFVDRRYRRQGVATAALRGAVELVAAAGGGHVETYPEDTTESGTRTASHLYNGTRSLFEQAGFTYVRPKGTKHCVMTLDVPAAPTTRRRSR